MNWRYRHVHIAGGPIAGLVAPVAATVVAVRYGWRVGVALGFLVAETVFGPFAWRIRPMSRSGPSSRCGSESNSVR